MSLARDEQQFGFYLPHHEIFKENSLTTKVRVVFDGSAKSDSGLSLNDTLMVGPTMQDDVVTHILRFRLHNYVLTGDIEKMYRQFEIRKEDRKFQRILWRLDGVNVQTFELNTVTFGMSSSPFLAIRALRQLADDESYKYPNAAIILKRDLYVDDLITGTETVEQGIRIRDEIIKLLNLGGLNIRQWASNETQLLQGIPESNVNQHLHFNNDQKLKTLGVSWSSANDKIIYFANSPVINSKISKRTILSEIVKLFDPLCLLEPITFFAKILMQRLWEFKLNWDKSVPNSIHKTWIEFRSELTLVNDLSCNRKVIIEGAIDIQLHGFCDASEKGYGACIYIRSTNSQDHFESRLLCAKSRVAPLKTIPIARLELCGAQLLSKLYTTVEKSIQISISKTVFWTDSTIVFFWINTSPHRLETCIANRVLEIQEKTNPHDWRHIRSDDNPADALSRGQMPATFIKNNLWKFGPNWLKNEESTWPKIEIQTTKKMPGLKKEICLTILPEKEFFHKFSSYSKLKRVIAYCLRMKVKVRQTGFLKVSELINAEKAIIRATQMNIFIKEMDELRSGKRVEKKAPSHDLTHSLIDMGSLE